MNEKNYKVLIDIIGCVETGGQVYGKARYNAYTPPYTNSKLEHTITLGAFQFYGHEAEELIQLIFNTDVNTFKSIDPSGIVSGKLNQDWVQRKWNPSTIEKNILVKLISSDVGKVCQDKLIKQRLDKYLSRAKDFGVTSIFAQMMWAEIQHLGGLSAVHRVFNKVADKNNIDSIMTALKSDQNDKSSDNQVGDKKYWSRHEKCYEYIKQYATEEVKTTMQETTRSTIVDEFLKYIGTKEYDGIVATIQKWYYGSLVKDAWCATSTSYFANVVGILDQLGGKNEGVSQMMKATKKLHSSDGRYWEYPSIPSSLKKHDVIFFKRNGSSHVAHLWRDEKYSGTGMINVLGGNQSDMICKKDYKQANIQAVYRPDYGATPTPSPTDKSLIKKGQEYLNQYIDANLDVDGVCGPLTLTALTKAIQTALNSEWSEGLDVDGSYGVLTNNAIKAHTIRKGANNALVGALQMGLYVHNFNPNGWDDNFGSGCEKAVKDFQRVYGLEVDGIAGQNTFRTLATRC